MPKTYKQTLGFEKDKLNNLDYHTPKYDLGRLTNDIGLQALMTPAGQAQLQTALRANQFYKDARVEGDKIHYTGQHGQPVTIDYIKASHGKNPELSYLTSDKPGGISGGVAVPRGGGGGNVLGGLLGGFGGGAAPANPLMGNNYSNQIMQYLMKQLAINKTLGGQ
jgi:hypothetical protein